MMQSRSLKQIELEQIAELLRERAERNEKKQDIYRAIHKEHLRAAAKVWEEDHKKRKGIYKREGGKTQTEITSGSTDVEETRKQRILHSTPCKDCGKLFGNKRELDRHQTLEVAYKPRRDAARTARLTCGGCKRMFSHMYSLNEHHRRLACLALRK